MPNMSKRVGVKPTPAALELKKKLTNLVGKHGTFLVLYVLALVERDRAFQTKEQWPEEKENIHRAAAKYISTCSEDVGLLFGLGE